MLTAFVVFTILVGLIFVANHWFAKQMSESLKTPPSTAQKEMAVSSNKSQPVKNNFSLSDDPFAPMPKETPELDFSNNPQNTDQKIIYEIPTGSDILIQ